MADAARLDYRLLGPLAVFAGEDVLTPSQAKQRSVLALLLLNLNRPMSSDQLIELVWPEKAPGRPQTALQGYVSALRKAFGSAAIETTAAGYVLRAAPEQVDVHRFEARLRAGLEALAAERVEHAALELGDALDLWRGPALCDFTYEGWAQQEIARLEELRAVAREQQIEARLALGRHDELVGELETFSREHPLREKPRGQLMLALYRSGRQAEALDVYQQARERLLEELGIDPSLALQTLYKQILNQEEALSVEPPAARAGNNLPAAPNRLIGRRREREEIEVLLGGDSRLVTLTGPGGIGKTRLAHETATHLIERFRDGVYFVPLAPISDCDLLIPTIAKTLGVRETAGQGFAGALATYVTERHMLLVLDNFEQLVPAAPAVASLLAGAPRLSVIVTSRTPLHLSGERLYPVPPLALLDTEKPCDVEALVDSEAVSLFVERARAVKRDFAITNENARTVAEICVRLDGLPLAIELAAARVRALPPQVLLRRLDRRLILLTGGAQDLDERQQTLRATIDWSYRLLVSDEQELFARLAVFVGGCRIEAAEAVCDPARTGDVVNGLEALVESSLLDQREDADGEPRFWMLETIREYAQERLLGSDEGETISDRHATFVLTLLSEVEDQLGDPQADASYRRLDAEIDNLRAAFRWLERTRSLERASGLVRALYRFCNGRGYLSDGQGWLQAVAAQIAQPISRPRAAALDYAGDLACARGLREQATALAEEALAIFTSLRDQRGIASVLQTLAAIARDQRDYERAKGCVERSLRIYTSLGDEVGAAHLVSHMSDLLLLEGEFARAAEVAEAGLRDMRGRFESRTVSNVCGNLGLAQLRLGQLKAARQAYTEALELAAAARDRACMVYALLGLAAVEMREGDDERAGTLTAAAESIQGEAGFVLEPAEAELYEETASALGSALGRRALDACRSEGRAMTVDAAVAFALRARSALPTALR
jgi:predicted ATPase/DNA-binding SARP family transcriptional activator